MIGHFHVRTVAQWTAHILLTAMVAGCACKILEGPSREELTQASSQKELNGPTATIVVLRMEKNRSVGTEADRYSYIALEEPGNVVVELDRDNWLTGGFGKWTEFKVSPGTNTIIAFSVYERVGRGNWVCDGYYYDRVSTQIELDLKASETYRLILVTDYDIKPIVALSEVDSWPSDAELAQEAFTKPGPR